MAGPPPRASPRVPPTPGLELRGRNPDLGERGGDADLEDLRARLPTALAAAGVPPEPDTLKRLLASGDIEAFSLLDAASAEWSVEARGVLWRRLAGCSRDDDQRRAWKRLAALGA